MNNNEPRDPNAIDMRSSIERRLADLRATPDPIMPDRPARRLPPRSRNTSRRHRAIR